MDEILEGRSMDPHSFQQISRSALVNLEKLGRIASFGAARAMQNMSDSFQCSLKARGIRKRTGSNFYLCEMHLDETPIAG